MKITDIKTYVVGLDRNFMFVEVLTDEGIIGLGEGRILLDAPASTLSLTDLDALYQ